jgi:hypothetical protein
MSPRFLRKYIQLTGAGTNPNIDGLRLAPRPEAIPNLTLCHGNLSILRGYEG